MGVHGNERGNRQEIVINLELEAPVTDAATTDRIENAVDYETVAKRVQAHVASASDFLVEKLAVDISQILLAEFHGVQKVRVRVEKPYAIEFVDAIGVDIERQRDNTP